MIIRYTEEKFNNAISHGLLSLECEVCHKIYSEKKHHIIAAIRGEKHRVCKYCSHKCSRKGISSYISIECEQCGQFFNKQLCKIKRCNHHFCSRSCGAKYGSIHNNNHIGWRSKLEKWLENKFKELYPNLEVCYNRRDIIDFELDIYIPSLKLAFEINGIWHYKKINKGQDLERIQKNDKEKLEQCDKKDIDLYIIDTSQHKYYKEDSCLPYLNIITGVLDLYLLNQTKYDFYLQNTLPL